MRVGMGLVKMSILRRREDAWKTKVQRSGLSNQLNQYDAWRIQSWVIEH